MTQYNKQYNKSFWVNVQCMSKKIRKCSRLRFVNREPAAYLKAAEGLEAAGSVQGTELWALLVGSVVAVLLLLVLFILLCFAHRRWV